MDISPLVSTMAVTHTMPCVPEHVETALVHIEALVGYNDVYCVGEVYIA